MQLSVPLSNLVVVDIGVAGVVGAGVGADVGCVGDVVAAGIGGFGDVVGADVGAGVGGIGDVVSCRQLGVDGVGEVADGVVGDVVGEIADGVVGDRR